MPTGLAYSSEFLRHQPSISHPESPARLKAAYGALIRQGLLEKLTPIEFASATTSQIRLVHTAEYIDRVRQACATGQLFIDSPDTEICHESYQTALLAVGAVTATTDAIMSRTITNGLCLIRPPGHHARPNQAMGFCLFNNAAIAARYLQRTHHLGRILILDWDVHHGNGTQEVFYNDPTVLYASFHQSPQTCYPGTGYASETGQGPSRGTTLNMPLEPNATDEDYRTLFETTLRPSADRFAPEFILVSAGFDAHRDDPLGGLRLSLEGFDFLLHQTCFLAERFAHRRLLLVLEGGYNLHVLAEAICSQAGIMLTAAG